VQDSDNLKAVPSVTLQISGATNDYASTASVPQNKQLDRVKNSDGDEALRKRTTSVGSQRSISGSQSKLEKQVASPFVRQDIFYSGSVTSLHEFKTSPNMDAYVQV
jgi:hypothetical protein